MRWTILKDYFAKERFSPRKHVDPDRSVRYEIIRRGGTNPIRVVWTKVVPPDAGPADYSAAQAERDEKIRQLRIGVEQPT